MPDNTELHCTILYGVITTKVGHLSGIYTCSRPATLTSNQMIKVVQTMLDLLLPFFFFVLPVVISGKLAVKCIFQKLNVNLSEAAN